MTSKLTRSASSINCFGGKCYPSINNLSLHPKISMYRSDGFGRDGYIRVDNGGFGYNWNNKFRIIKTSTYDMMKLVQPTSKFPRYKSTGNGRDSYIYEECGGFYREKYLPNVNSFYSSLKGNDQYKKIKENNYIAYTQKFKSPSIIEEERKLRQKQRLLSLRLSIPKKRRQAYNL